MERERRTTDAFPRLTTRLELLAAGLLCCGLLLAPSASATWEQTGTFAGSATPLTKEQIEKEGFSEEVQLGGVGGMAVNVSGTGGVPAGTVYAATQLNSEGVRVAMFEPEGSGLKFTQSWQVTFKEEAYERCGPASGTKCPKRIDGLPGKLDVVVDQTTGNVYVYNSQAFSPGEKAIVVYKADGSTVISRFGEIAAEGETTAETPTLIHSSSYPGQLAVNEAGEVYVYDLNIPDNFYRRLMVFKPQSPGDFEHYVYAGEVSAGSQGTPPAHPMTDAAGNVYAFSESGSVNMYAPETPAPYPATSAPPVCHYEFSKGGIESMAVNPASGEVFFYSIKNPKRVRRLGPCDEAMGKFTETSSEPEAFTVTPERGDLSAMAFDPLREVEGRGPGVLYAGAQGAEPGSGVGKGEPGQSSLGYIFGQVKEIAPEVESETVSRVTTTTASLKAQINPKGSQTRYVFQYITEAAHQANEPTDRFAGAAEAPPGGALLGEGSESIAAAVALSGLSADTAYRYRVVATSHCSGKDPEKVCEDSGEDQSFHTFPVEASGPPDNRAWELVSPAQKNGGEVFPADPSIDSCLGNCKPGSTAAHYPIQASLNGEAIIYEGYSFSPGQGAIAGNQYIAHRDPKAGWQTTPLSPRHASSGSGQGYTAVNSELTQSLLFQIDPTLSPEAPSEYANLYTQPTTDPLALSPLLVAEPPNRLSGGGSGFKVRYAGSSVNLSRAFFEANDALTGETPFAPEALDGGAVKYNLYEWSEGQLRLVNVMPGNAATQPGASFGAASANSISADGSRAFFSDESGQLYVRENGEATREIPDSSKFLSASLDGSKVLLSSGHLYDLESETTTDLSEGKGGFEGLVGQSDDLSRIYFVDTAVLDEAADPQGAIAEAGKHNLYAWSEGGTPRYVATLVSQDNSGLGLSPASDWAAVPSNRTAEASPHGRFLAFLSQARLTGYDNAGPCGVAATCPEAFLYDSATDQLTCASCNPSGTRPLGYTVLRLTSGESVQLQPRYLTDSGRLYFDSQDSLSPFDTNEGIEDVYEYEPNEVGTCKRPAGCVALISAGHEAIDSNFFAMDEGGKSVFFTSRDQLVLKDKDDLVDLYVAREGGGPPGETEAARSECQGEACVPALSPPNDPTPGSSSFEGAGNVDEKKAAKKHKKKHKKSAHKRAAKHNRRGAK